MNNAPKVWSSFGDVNPMEHGGGFWKLVAPMRFEVLKWTPSEEVENSGTFESLLVELDDSWIDHKDVCSTMDLSAEDIYTARHAIDCIEYYGAQNFGGGYEERITIEAGIERFKIITALDAIEGA